MPAIIIRNYEHINKSFGNWDKPNGKYIKNKDHYDRTMKEQGMVSYETMQQRAESNRKKERSYVPSDKALGIVRHAIERADKKGNVKLDGRAIEALKEMKAKSAKLPNYLKNSNGKQGGFYGK